MAVEHEDDSGRLVRLIHLDDLSDDDLGTVRDLMQRVVRLDRAADPPRSTVDSETRLAELRSRLASRLETPAAAPLNGRSGGAPPDLHPIAESGLIVESGTYEVLASPFKKFGDVSAFNRAVQE